MCFWVFIHMWVYYKELSQLNKKTKNKGFGHFIKEDMQMANQLKQIFNIIYIMKISTKTNIKIPIKMT
jgi:hypothetical protein